MFGFVTKYACDRRTDRETDRRTDRDTIATPKTALASLRRAVKVARSLEPVLDQLGKSSETDFDTR